MSFDLRDTPQSSETPPVSQRSENSSQQIAIVPGKDKNESEPQSSLLDVVSTAQVGNLDQTQKLALLTALGINPEYLLSSGVFDKSTFMALLGGSGQG